MGSISRYASMPVWLIALVAIAVIVALALVVGVRRPRSIEDELHQAPPAPPIGAAPSAQAPLAQAPLATTIAALIRNKATGKLEVTSGDQSCSLYFLFGHLFHAESGGLKGEDALEVALAWLHPSTMFDPQAHLPSQETILRPPA
jgi:hypothetical protein